MASGLSFLALALKSSPAPRTEKRIEAVQTRRVTSKFKKPFFVALMCAFLFLYVGAEIALGAYLTLFCVRSGVFLSREEGRSNNKCRVNRSENKYHRYPVSLL